MTISWQEACEFQASGVCTVRDFQTRQCVWSVSTAPNGCDILERGSTVRHALLTNWLESNWPPQCSSAHEIERERDAQQETEKELRTWRLSQTSVCLNLQFRLNNREREPLTGQDKHNLFPIDLVETLYLTSVHFPKQSQLKLSAKLNVCSRYHVCIV